MLHLIGNTPLVEITCFDTGPCRLFAKLECQNPGGSIKDRVALYMIRDAELQGHLKPGGTVIEATAGNTGLGLALVAALRGYKIILVIPDKMSREKIAHLRAMGAEIISARSDVPKGHPDHYQDTAKRIASQTPGAFYIDQFNNPANPKAHAETTGPEIWKQTEGKVDAVVCGVGSGGTIAGLSSYFATVAPHVELVLADPIGSILTHYVKSGEILSEAGSWLVEGIGEDFVPSIANLSKVRQAYSISDKESILTARTLLRKQGILGGSSSGTLLSAAIRFCQQQSTAKTVVTFVCDTGNKYLSKMYSDGWMAEQGFTEKNDFHDLRDVIVRQHQEGATVFVTPTDTLQTAYARMKLYDVSQLPVLENNRAIGIIDEGDLLIALSADKKTLRSPVKDHMSAALITLPPSASIEELTAIFHRGFVAVIQDPTTFYGLITKMDYVSYLRQKTVQ